MTAGTTGYTPQFVKEKEENINKYGLTKKELDIRFSLSEKGKKI